MKELLKLKLFARMDLQSKMTDQQPTPHSTPSVDFVVIAPPYGSN